MKKLSELMLEGYALAGERQAFSCFFYGDCADNPDAVCAEGAVYLASTGSAVKAPKGITKDFLKFTERVGFRVSDLNDEGMSIPDIAGIAAAEGL